MLPRFRDLRLAPLVGALVQTLLVSAGVSLVLIKLLPWVLSYLLLLGYFFQFEGLDLE